MKKAAFAVLMITFIAACAAAAEPNTLTPQEKADGWMLLFDGKSLDGWVASEGPGSYRIANGKLTVWLAERDASGVLNNAFRVQDGELLALGPRSHLFYVGSAQNHDFRNFELTLDLKTWPGANSGIYFHTKFDQADWPTTGYEVQVNNSFDSDPSRTAGLWGVQDNKVVPVKDGEWFTLHIKVQGKHIQTWVNGKVIADYTEEPNPSRSDELKGRLIGSGTFALQAHHAGNEVHYRNIKVRPLP